MSDPDASSTPAPGAGEDSPAVERRWRPASGEPPGDPPRDSGPSSGPNSLRDSEQSPRDSKPSPESPPGGDVPDSGGPAGGAPTERAPAPGGSGSEDGGDGDSGSGPASPPAGNDPDLPAAPEASADPPPSGTGPQARSDPASGGAPSSDTPPAGDEPGPPARSDDASGGGPGAPSSGAPSTGPSSTPDAQGAGGTSPSETPEARSGDVQSGSGRGDSGTDDSGPSEPSGLPEPGEEPLPEPGDDPASEPGDNSLPAPPDDPFPHRGDDPGRDDAPGRDDVSEEAVQRDGKQVNEEAFSGDDDRSWTDQVRTSEAPPSGERGGEDPQESYFTDEHRRARGAEQVEEGIRDFAYDVNEGAAGTDWTPSEREAHKTASMFALLVGKVAEDMSYQRAPGDEFWDPRKIMRRQIDNRPLSHCKMDYTKRRLALLVDTSPSCRDEAVFYSKIASGAMLRDDIDIFLCPNGRIDAKFDPEPMRFVTDDRGADWDLGGRTVLYFTDWDGTDEIVAHSRACNLYWFDNCPPGDYWNSSKERHRRVRLRYRGHHFHCPDSEVFRRLARKIRP